MSKNFKLAITIVSTDPDGNVLQTVQLDEFTPAHDPAIHIQKCMAVTGGIFSGFRELVAQAFIDIKARN